MNSTLSTVPIVVRKNNKSDALEGDLEGVILKAANSAREAAKAKGKSKK